MYLLIIETLITIMLELERSLGVRIIPWQLKQIFIYLFNAMETKKACEETVKTRNSVLLISTILTCILLNIQNVMLLAKGQRGNAYFKEVEYPKSHIYQYNKDLWNFSVQTIVYNENCTVADSDQAWFFFKFYRDDELWWNEYNDSTYKVWRCDMGHTVRCPYQFLIPVWSGPKNYDFKIELYWDEGGTPHLLDTTSFSITCVLIVHLSYITVLSYFFVYSLATFLLLFYLLITRHYEFWT